MKRQERRGAEGDGDLSDASGAEEERPESAEQPVAQRQVRRPPATTTKDDELLLEQEILRDHRSHATGATQLRGHDGQVQQGEQEILHARVSVGQTSGATQRCPIREISARIGNSRPTGPLLVSRGLVAHSERALGWAGVEELRGLNSAPRLAGCVRSWWCWNVVTNRKVMNLFGSPPAESAAEKVTK